MKTYHNALAVHSAIALTAVWIGIGAAHAEPDRQGARVSPALRIDHTNERTRGSSGRPRQIGNAEARRIDGTDNNQDNPDYGSALIQLERLVDADYADGISALAGSARPNPRTVSNIVAAQQSLIENELGASDFLWQWGQFVDHDIDLTDGVDPPEPTNITVPAGDEFFSPGSEIPFNRSIYDPTSGVDTPRQQLNEITAWIDASNVYGSSDERASALRTLDGTGKLRTSDGDYLPYNFDGYANAGGDDPSLYLAGDPRANEQIGLTVMHTLFVREHNRIATNLARSQPNWSGERIYEKARQLVGAQMQAITYNEFLPALLGTNALAPYNGYQPQRNPNIVTEFSSAAYRFGHSALSPQLLRLDAQGNESAYGHLPLRNAFFAPYRMTSEDSMDSLLRGLASQLCQKIDPYVIDDVRNFLFGDPLAGGFDLVTLNIQRGRDHGLPSYNDTRRQLGLSAAGDFSDITQNEDLQQRLAAAYATVEDIDLWVGGLAEDNEPRAHVGELFFRIIKDQFEALRDGDRFWYELTLNARERERIESTRLSDIIKRNTGVGEELQTDVFHVPGAGSGRQERGRRPAPGLGADCNGE
jgi:hypothetical protein